MVRMNAYAAATVAMPAPTTVLTDLSVNGVLNWVSKEYVKTTQAPMKTINHNNV